MSFDDDHDGEPDEDWDDNWHWYDEPPAHVKEEPDCHVCNDAGGRCCEPTRIDILRWRVRSGLRRVWDKLRRRRQVPVDDPRAPATPSASPASSDGFVDAPPF